MTLQKRNATGVKQINKKNIVNILWFVGLLPNQHGLAINAQRKDSKANRT